MLKTNAAFANRIGTNDQETTPKLGRNPIGAMMTESQRVAIVAALTRANEKLNLFPKK